MTQTLVQCLSMVVNAFRSFTDFIFSTNYPGFTITIGAVLFGIFMISIGFDYIDFFLGSSHVRDDK